MAASRPPSVTAQLKKFSTTMRMVQHIARARESILSALANLDAVERFLLETLDLSPDEVPPPSTKPAPRGEALTSFSPAWDAAAFEKHVLKTYKDEATEAGRANVRALVEKGVGAGLLNEKQARELLAKLK